MEEAYYKFITKNGNAYAIKFCPFCGGKPYLEQNSRNFVNGESTRVAYVRCTECHARSERFRLTDFGHTSHSTEAETKAVEAWNRRVDNE